MAKASEMASILVDVAVQADGKITAEYDIDVTAMDEEETEHDQH